MKPRALQFLAFLVGAGISAELWSRGVEFSTFGFVVCAGFVVDAVLEDWRPRP